MAEEQGDYLGRMTETLLGERVAEVVTTVGSETSVAMDSPLGMMIGTGFVLYAVASILKTPTVKIVAETGSDILKDNHRRQHDRQVEKTARERRREELTRELEALDKER
mgnify:CR=1 FL=1